ncbi:MAG: 1-deoxy-D-xylulose-5-phosphate synthase [Actinobacteria bacterium]|nr:1-deoxy-D-xylulose-5-phosphate synthase [Actinomycetota bacterium]
MDEILPTIQSPADIRSLDIPQLAQLSREIRDYIIKTLATTGGHLAPSLGVVELTLVLHYLYNTPCDKIVWDVGHQAYTHKIITGRREEFKTIRQHNGISGFPKISESPYDAYGVGHASTAISAALGIACARDLAGDDYRILAIVGDGALTGGLSYEGLNNAGASGRDMVVVLNDNTMSISPNVGAISRYLTHLIANPLYNRMKNDIWQMTGKFDRMGPKIRWATRRIEESVKGLVTPGIVFERLGFRYFGPIDGHNIARLIHIFRQVRTLKGPIFVHVLTKKGKGFAPAEKNAPVFHGLGKFDPITGEIIKSTTRPTYTKIFGRTMVDLARKNEKLVGITAAMALGTGLSQLAEEFPERFFDVGIAEGHAVTFAGGLAAQGMRPVVAIYSSFLQRGYDQIIHDVALQKLPVIFAIDRAGVVGDDGPTHHGVFDLAFLRVVPNLVIMVPKDEEELRQMLWTATEYKKGPVAIRYPRGVGEGVTLSETYTSIPIGSSEVLREGTNAVILGVGPILSKALAAAEVLQNAHQISVQVVNARFVKPVDVEMLTRISAHHNLIITVEEGTLKGGFGSEVAEFLVDRNISSVELIRIGIPDTFVEQGNRNILLDDVGLSVDGIINAIRKSNIFQSHKKGKLLFFKQHSKI